MGDGELALAEHGPEVKVVLRFSLDGPYRLRTGNPISTSWPKEREKLVASLPLSTEGVKTLYHIPQELVARSDTPPAT